MSSPAPHDARPGETIDLVADLNAQDDDGYGWSILSAARVPSRGAVGRMVLAGSTQAAAVVRVVAVGLFAMNRQPTVDLHWGDDDGAPDR